jgi:hypothetical protein
VFIPTLQNSELLAITGWYTPSLPPIDWEIERHQANGIPQNIQTGWWVWWDHMLSTDPLKLLEYAASRQLSALAGDIGDVAGDIEAIEDDVEQIGDDVDAVESDVDAVEVLVEKLRLVNRTVYTSGSGTHSFDADTSSVFYIVCGGGGAGGDADGTGLGTATAGGGGGGGGVAQKMVLKGALASAAYVVGSAGNGSSINHGVLSIDGNAGAAGPGGVASPGGVAGGVGGTATGGDMNSVGQAGSSSINIGSSQAMSGEGGSSVMGGGGVGRIAITSGSGSNGGAGGNYGGGGGGAAAGATGGNRTGGAGAPGIVIIEEYGIGV